MIDEQEHAMRLEVRRLAREKIAPRAAEIDEKGEYPWDVLELFKGMGLLGIFVPEQYGGTGLSMTAACGIAEEIAQVCVNSTYILAAHALGSINLLMGGSEAQKQSILRKLASGEWLCATAMTEPNAGSDLGSLETTAVKKGADYVLNGTKIFCSNADVADVIFVFASTNPSLKHNGISIFAVEKGTPGLAIGHKEEKLGTRANSACEVILEDCKIHEDHRIGKEGEGFATGMRTLDRVRPFAAAAAVGLAQGALDHAVGYAKERIQFGRPIAAFQGIQFMMADMAMTIEAARQLTYEAARKIDDGESNVSAVGAMAKAFAAEMVMKVTTDALQILGGHGYTKKHPLERMMRDAKLFAIGEGTTQIQKVIIARELLKP